MEDEIRYMKDHPPRCLGGPSKSLADDLCEAVQEQIGNNCTVFNPVCECTSEFFGITSSKDFAPLIISCFKCGKKRTVFDPTQHGYDGELGHNADSEMATPEARVCSECESRSFRIALGFQYSGETDVLEEKDAPDVKPEDLFGSFMAMAKCKECNTIQEVAQAECA